MKKKSVAALILAAALASQPMCVFASSSSSSDDGGSSATTTTTTSSTKSESTVTVSSTGVKTTGATTSAAPNGSTIGVAVDTVTTTGVPVTVNSRGEAVVGDIAIGFAKDPGSATAGLPENVVAAINNINAGKALSEVVQGVDVSGYNALTGTHAIVTKDAATGAVKDTAAEVSLYVPNQCGSSVLQQRYGTVDSASRTESRSGYQDRGGEHPRFRYTFCGLQEVITRI